MKFARMMVTKPLEVARNRRGAPEMSARSAGLGGGGNRRRQAEAGAWSLNQKPAAREVIACGVITRCARPQGEIKE